MATGNGATVGRTVMETADGLLLSTPLLTTSWNFKDAGELIVGAVNVGFGEDESDRETLGPDV